MRTVYMVRHGETTANAQGVATGRLDVELTDRGRMQAEACRAVIHGAAIPVGTIICSGLRRTGQTAEIINRELGCPVLSLAELNEQAFGAWEGVHWEVVRAEMEQHGEDPPGGESRRAFRERAVTAVRSLVARHDGNVLFVTHAGVIEALLALHERPYRRAENGVLYELVFSADGMTLHDVRVRQQ